MANTELNKLPNNIRRRITLCDKNGCWLFSNPKPCGYASISLNGKCLLAHRVTFSIFNGPIKNGLEIDHLCGVKNCVNPNHLEQVTHRVNALRAKKGFCALNSSKTHCKNGHLFSPDNTRIVLRKRGNKTCKMRQCRRCERLASNRYYKRKNIHKPTCKKESA